jgi:hypothetical protein
MKKRHQISIYKQFSDELFFINNIKIHSFTSLTGIGALQGNFGRYRCAAEIAKTPQCIYCYQMKPITNWHYPELRGYFTLKSLLHSGLKQVISLFTLGSARAVLVVALAYSFPDIFNVIMALNSPYINQPFIVPSWNCENTPMHILLSNETWIYLL